MRTRHSLLAFLSGLAVCGCTHATNEVWRRPDGARVAMLESGTIEGSSGIQTAGKDTLIRFRNRTLLLRGFDEFEGTVSTHRIKLEGPALSVRIDEDELRIEDRSGTRPVKMRVDLSELPRGETTTYDDGTLTFGPHDTSAAMPEK